MVPDKKFKPKKGKKMQEFLSKEEKNFEQSAVDEGLLKPFPRGNSKKSKSSLSQQSPPAKHSSLQQLFDSRNASSKHKKSHLTKENETEMPSEVTLKVKKRKDPTAVEMIEELPRNKKKGISTEMIEELPRKKKKDTSAEMIEELPRKKKDTSAEMIEELPRKKKKKRKDITAETIEELPLKKKRKGTTAEMIEELPLKKRKNATAELIEEQPEPSEVQTFPRGSPKQSLDGKPDRQSQRSRRKLAKLRSKEEELRLGQTLFVGNLPISITRKGLEKLFSKFGIVESVRLRGAIPVRTQIPKKIADITRNFHDGLHSRKGFVVFEDAAATTSALILNGTLIDGHHIIVDKASGTGQRKMYDNKRTIFVGNLPFDVDDENVWSAFEVCGEVEAVRVIRDKTTGAGKGFGYVLFKTEDSKEAAINKENVEISGRIVRIKSVEGSKNQKGPKQQTFQRGLALKAKSKNQNPQSRKSTKKLMKKEKIRHDKKKIASNFKTFF